MRAVIVHGHMTSGLLEVGDALTFACGYVPVFADKTKEWHLEHHPAVYGQVVEGGSAHMDDAAESVPVYIVKVNNGRRYAAHVQSAGQLKTIQFTEWNELLRRSEQQRIA